MSSSLQRRDFLRLRHEGVIARSAAFLLQAHARREQPLGAARLGFTITKRVGNAVERNRIRRRLREAVLTADAGWMRPGHDYAVIARRDVLSLPHARLVRDLGRAFNNVHKALDKKSGQGGRQNERRSAPNRADPIIRDGCS